jgi:hypothetical protein
VRFLESDRTRGREFRALPRPNEPGPRPIRTRLKGAASPANLMRANPNEPDVPQNPNEPRRAVGLVTPIRGNERNPGRREIRTNPRPAGILGFLRSRGVKRTRARADRANTSPCAMVTVASGGAAMRFYNFEIVMSRRTRATAPTTRACPAASATAAPTFDAGKKAP